MSQLGHHDVFDFWPGVGLDLGGHGPRPAQHELQLFQLHVGPPKRHGPHQLGLHGPLVVDEDCGEVGVRVVWDAGGRYRPDELGGGELGGQLAQEVVDDVAEHDALLVEVEDHPNSLTCLVDLKA